MAGKSSRAVRFTRNTLTSEKWTRPAKGLTDEAISDVELPGLKLRVRRDGRAAWYVHFKNPDNGKRKKQKLEDLDPKKHPDEVRKMARTVLEAATIAKHIPGKRGAFKNRNMSVADVVNAYIDRLEIGHVSRTPKPADKTIIGYRKDHTHIEKLFAGVAAVNLTVDILHEKAAENVDRIKQEREDKILAYRARVDQNLKEIQNPEKYGLTPRNIRRRYTDSNLCEDRVERLTSPKQKTGAAQNRNSTVLIRAAFKEMADKPNMPEITSHFEMKFPKYERKSRSLSQDQINTFLDHCTEMLDAKKESWQHACLAVCLMLSGARKTELMTARTNTIRRSGTNGAYTIACAYNKEGNKTKRVEFFPEADPFLEALVKSSDKGGLWEKTAYPDTAVRNIMRAAGIENWTGFHDFRHTFASICLSSGVSLPKLASLLGQQTVSITQIYGHMFDEERSEAMSQAGGYLSQVILKKNPPASI